MKGGMTERILTSSALTVDLGRIRANYRTIQTELGSVPAAAMVKANGYGLGVTEVSSALWDEGCRVFFVAQVAEGEELRECLPDAEIHVLNGAMPGTEEALRAGRLIPVLNSLDQIAGWTAEARRGDQPLPATVHFDTGMSRLGLAQDETATLQTNQALLDGLDVRHVMSHLASADVAGSAQSAQQLASFQEIRRAFPAGSASLANSAGIFLGTAYHFDLVRPGIALFGGTPRSDGSNPMLQTITLEAPIVQVRNVQQGEVIGYGATHTMERPGRVATIAVGYADGFLRSASGAGTVWLAGSMVPIIGRVSMDLITLDVTDVPTGELYLGAPVELIGDHCPIDDVAARAGSIANELLTDLGRRYQRTYV